MFLLYFKANVCFVDIDAGIVELPEELPSFPHHADLCDELLLHLNFRLDSLARDPAYRESWAGNVDSGLSRCKKFIL